MDLKANKITIIPSADYCFAVHSVNCFCFGLYTRLHTIGKLYHIPSFLNHHNKPCHSVFLIAPVHKSRCQLLYILTISLQSNKHCNLSQILTLVSLLALLSFLHCGFAIHKQLLRKHLSWLDSSLKIQMSHPLHPKQCVALMEEANHIDPKPET